MNGIVKAATWFQGAHSVTREIEGCNSLVIVEVMGLRFVVPKQIVLDCPYLQEVFLQSRIVDGETEYLILEAGE